MTILDPFCGTGTLVIEAVMLGRKLAPGRRREFMLPFVAAARILRTPLSFQNRLRALDARLLRAYPRLRYYATVIVFELFEPAEC